MSVSFEKGDIFATRIKALAHGCNNYGAMGAGIAVAFRRKFPEMYQAYKDLCQDGKLKLGDVFIWKSDDIFVFNLITQDTVATLPAIKRSLRTALKHAEETGITEIALPAIGSGLGGLDWRDVKKVIIAVGTDSPVKLRVCETFIEGAPMKVKSVNNPLTRAKYLKDNKEILKVKYKEYYQNNRTRLLSARKVRNSK